METKVKRNGKGRGRKEGNHFVSSKGWSVISFLILRRGKLLFSRDQQIKNISFRLEYLTLDRSHFFSPSNTSQENARMCNMVDMHDVNAIN